MKYSGIILAGGNSSRMGQDKTVMYYKNETLVERAVREMEKAVDDIIIADNQREKHKIAHTTEVSDIFTGMGPMGGIHAGLLAAKYRKAFFIACDMPFFTSDLAVRMLEMSDGYDVVVPRINNKLEPLCAVYSKNCIRYIEQCLNNDIRTVYEFYPFVRVLEVNETIFNSLGKVDNLFFNLNTPSDYKRLIDMNNAAET